MKIKFCGLTSIDDINCINEVKPDFIGFIFAQNSKRIISIEKAKEMKALLNPNIKSVGVFVDENVENIINIANENVIDVIQLHGNENNEYISEIKEKINLPVIKAFKSDSNLEENIKKTNADYILIDSHSNNSFGGTGETFDWELIPETNKKIFLAGGLNSDNIIKAIKTVKPYCVDINSGVETNGKKDKRKIIEITKIIKGYKNEQN